MVSEFSTREVLDVYQVRLALEPLAMREAFPNYSRTDVATMWDICDQMVATDVSEIERLYVTDSVEPQLEHEKIEVVSVAGLFGEAIRRISQKESISVLFS